MSQLGLDLEVREKRYCKCDIYYGVFISLTSKDHTISLGLNKQEEIKMECEKDRERDDHPNPRGGSPVEAHTLGYELL